VEVDGANLLYRPTGQKALHLDQTASVIWQLCDGTRTTRQLAREIASFYPDLSKTVTGDVEATLEELLSHGAIVAATKE
jgi:hypothetical protein